MNLKRLMERGATLTHPISANALASRSGIYKSREVLLGRNLKHVLIMSVGDVTNDQLITYHLIG